MVGRFVVISTWGSPLGWGDAVYTVEDSRVESCSSLIALLNHIVAERGVDVVERIYLLGLDSVIDVDPAEFGKCKERLCCRVFAECFEQCCRGYSYESYGDLLKASKQLYRCVFEKLLRESKCGGEACFSDEGVKVILGRTRVIVLPATGSLGWRLRFVGCPEDYLAKGLLETAPDAPEALKMLGEPVEVVFDASHGINYAPTLTLKLAEVLGQFIRLRHSTDVEVTVYNSDPYPRGAQRPELGVNVVYKKGVTEVEVPLYEEGLKAIVTCRLVPSRDEAFQAPPKLKHREFAKSVVEDVISTIYSPAPLTLLYACYSTRLEEQEPECVADTLMKFLESVGENWVSSVEVSNGFVKRKLKMVAGAIWAVLFSLTVCKRVGELARGRVKRVEGMPAFSLDLLKDLSEHVYAYVHSTMNYVVNQELSHVELFASSLNAGECRTYGSSTTRKDLTERVAIAHAGLPHGYVEVCLENGVFYVKYRDLESLEEVLNKLKNVYRGRATTRGRASQRVA